MNELYLSLFEKIDFIRIIDHPNILIAAAFWSDERYQAAKICYKYMRGIDDMIDNYKSTHPVIAESMKKEFIKNVNAWIALAKEPDNKLPAGHDLMETISRFHIPLWPLEDFARAMIYDIDHTGFQTLDDFLAYSQGASVAPASIFVHLNGLTRLDNAYAAPAFDVRSAATPCAIFSYLVHIIRDFRKDQLNNLNYFADDLLTRHGLQSSELKIIATNGKIPGGFREMIREYLSLADTYRVSTLQVMDDIFPLLEPRYRLSLQIIFNLYLMVFERINAEKGTFSTEELNPTPEEIRARVYRTIMDFRE
jgi:phytoene synthase